jgi:hypothetical protein
MRAPKKQTERQPFFFLFGVFLLATFQRMKKLIAGSSDKNKNVSASLKNWVGKKKIK